MLKIDCPISTKYKKSKDFNMTISSSCYFESAAREKKFLSQILPWLCLAAVDISY